MLPWGTCDSKVLSADSLAYRRLYSPRTRGSISYTRDFISLSARGMFHSYDYEGVDNDI